MLYIDTRANLPDDLLMVGDKMSMANSLEARVPFLDYRLVEFIESLPPKLKLNGFTGKYLHKKALEKWLPKECVWRKKKGFANPVEHWFRTRMRPLRRGIPAGAGRGRLPSTSISATSDACSSAIGTAREQLRRHIYLLVSFELWHRKFVRS